MARAPRHPPQGRACWDLAGAWAGFCGLLLFGAARPNVSAPGRGRTRCVETRRARCPTARIAPQVPGAHGPLWAGDSGGPSRRTSCHLGRRALPTAAPSCRGQGFPLRHAPRNSERPPPSCLSPRQTASDSPQPPARRSRGAVGERDPGSSDLEPPPDLAPRPPQPCVPALHPHPHRATQTFPSFLALRHLRLTSRSAGRRRTRSPLSPAAAGAVLCPHPAPSPVSPNLVGGWGELVAEEPAGHRAAGSRVLAARPTRRASAVPAPSVPTALSAPTCGLGVEFGSKTRFLAFRFLFSLRFHPARASRVRLPPSYAGWVGARHAAHPSAGPSRGPGLPGGAFSSWVSSPRETPRPGARSSGSRQASWPADPEPPARPVGGLFSTCFGDRRRQERGERVPRASRGSSHARGIRGAPFSPTAQLLAWGTGPPPGGPHAG